MRAVGAACRLLAALPFAAAPSAPAQGAESTPAPSAQALANQANNPNAPLMQLQLRNVAAPRLPGADGTANLLQLEAILPFKPRGIIPFPTLMKITIPYVTLPEPVDESNLGSIQIFDQAVFKESWGSWALGISLVFPSAAARDVDEETWQAGPAAAFMYTGVPNLVAGAVFQNPVSVGAGNRKKSNALIITPTLTYNLPAGWFVGYSDFNWSFDWESDGAATIPLGLQGGRVFNIGRQAFSLSIEAGYNVARPHGTSTPRWMIGFEFTALFPRIL